MSDDAPQFKEVVLTRAPSSRAASPKDLAAAARSSKVEISMEDDVAVALKHTLGRMKGTDTLIVSGSMTVVGEAKEYFTKSKKGK